MLKKVSNKTMLTVLCVASIVAFFSSSEIIFRVVALTELITCVLLGSRQKKITNPYYLFALTPLSLLLYVDLGGLYMLELSAKTWRLAIINIEAFIIALYITPSFKKYSNCISIRKTNVLIFSSISFYLISFIGSFVPELTALFWFLSVAAIVCAMKTKKKIMYVFCAYIILSSLLSGHTSKMTVLLQCITILVCYDKYFVSTKAERKRIFFLAGMAAVLMVFAFTFANKERGMYDSKEGMNYYLKQGKIEWNYNAALFMPYMYFETPWTNLEYVVETQDTRTNGLWMLKPILGYLGLAEKYKDDYELIPYSSFNTFTFIPPGFKDFGFVWSIILSIFLGFFVKKIYSRYEISKSPFDITSYILVALATAEMFFSNHFFMQSYPFTCFVIMEIWKILIGRTVSSSFVEIDK